MFDRFSSMAHLLLATLKHEVRASMTYDCFIWMKYVCCIFMYVVFFTLKCSITNCRKLFFYCKCESSNEFLHFHCQGSFPGNLHLVLVLRPTTLFQRTLSDFLFKFNKDEFKMKVCVACTLNVLRYVNPRGTRC